MQGAGMVFRDGGLIGMIVSVIEGMWAWLSPALIALLPSASANRRTGAVGGRSAHRVCSIIKGTVEITILYYIFDMSKIYLKTINLKHKK